MIRKPVPSRDELASLPYLLAFHDYSGIWLTAFGEDDYDFNLPVACNSIVGLYLSKRPSFAKRRFQILICFRVVGEPHLGGIPLQLALDAERDYAQQHPFDERSGYVEIRARRVAALAGANPVAVVAGRARQQRLRELVVLHLRHRDKPRLLAVGAGGDHAFIADNHAAVGLGDNGVRIVLRLFEILPVEHPADESGEGPRTAAGPRNIIIIVISGGLRRASQRHVTPNLAPPPP